MKPGTEVLLKENLKRLKLSNVLRQIETLVRQAKENGTDYGDMPDHAGDVPQKGHRLAGQPEKKLRGSTAPKRSHSPYPVYRYPLTRRWTDGSVANYGLQGGGGPGYVAYLQVAG
jgi:hypothetical protein